MPPAAGLLQEGLPPKRLSGHRLGCAGQATARYRDVFGRRTDVFQVAAGVPTGLGHHVRLPTHVGMAEGLAPRRGRGGHGSGTASDVGVRPGHGSRPPRSREPSAAGLHGPAPPRLWPALCSAPRCGLASAHPRWPNTRGACPRPAPRNRVARHTAARMFTGSFSTSREGTVCHSPSMVSATRGPSIVLGSSGNATRPALTEEALADRGWRARTSRTRRGCSRTHALGEGPLALSSLSQEERPPQTGHDGALEGASTPRASLRGPTPRPPPPGSVAPRCPRG